MNIYEQIIQAAETMQPELVACRRDFHKYAEKGWFEYRTTSFIAKALDDMGYELLMGDQVCKRDARMGVPSSEQLDMEYQRALAQGAIPKYAERAKDGMTGVIGILRCGEGPTVAMRFDIDALGVFEANDENHRPAKEGFRSVNEGVMHACGHDGHATIGLGTAKILSELKNSLHGTIKLIFQPAEEGVRGAKSIVENGNLDDVDYFLGAHNTDKSIDDPAVVVPGSYGSLATTKYDVTYTGVASHAGGFPELGKNALLAAATAVLNLYAIPRHSKGTTRVNVGTLHAGSGRNVIADRAIMEIEVRGETTEINQFVKEYAENILNSAAQMHGCTCESKLMGEASSQTSDLELAKRVRRVCEDELHLPVSPKDTVQNAGSEDISYMMNRVQERGGQATFMRTLTHRAAPGHNDRFDFDERYLKDAVKIFAATAYDILK